MRAPDAEERWHQTDARGYGQDEQPQHAGEHEHHYNNKDDDRGHDLAIRELGEHHGKLFADYQS